LTDEDRQARELFAGMARAAGLHLRLDRHGNIWAATHDDWPRPAVVCGSHLDTVPNGGRYDGTLGVLAGLEVVRSLSDQGRLPAVPLAVAVFAAEESSRFGVSTIGSKAAAGVLSDDALADLRDRGGTRYLDALETHGRLRDASVRAGPPGPIGCFLEMHVEQGRELELADTPLGVVQAIAAPTRFRATVHGEAAHSGATMMSWRKDGLAAAAELVLALERVAELEEDYGTVATATIFALHPVSINVVPGRVEMGVDIRGIDRASKQRAVERFRRTVWRVSAQRSIRIDLDVTADDEPVALSPEAVACVRAGCERAGARYQLMHSRAGHDSMNMARICPAGMLFVPSEGGISHHPREHTRPEHIVQGVDALLEAVLAAAAMIEGRAG
jgi:hydantoinase/carbamoylase family amidase